MASSVMCVVPNDGHLQEADFQLPEAAAVDTSDCSAWLSAISAKLCGCVRSLLNAGLVLQAALTAGQHHSGAAVPTGPPADVQAAMAGVSSDVQAVVRLL